MRVARRADSGGEVFGEGASISLPNPLAGGEGAASPLPTSKGVAVGALNDFPVLRGHLSAYSATFLRENSCRSR